MRVVDFISGFFRRKETQLCGPEKVPPGVGSS